MIVGNGLLANLFKENDIENIVFFASGVSNSLETQPKEFQREEDLLRKTLAENPEKIFVYFSTCSIYDSSKAGSLYVLHKHKMEQIISDTAKDYLILRVSNAVGKGGSPNLLMNYLVNAVKTHSPINVHTKATRNLINVEDIKNITYKLIEDKKYFNQIINVAYPENYTIVEILEIIESFYNIELNTKFIHEGIDYHIDTPFTKKYFSEKQSMDKKQYLTQILESYYS
ncbi:NAD-dependent epimerase/dehydratase family protein [Chryseobacterium sp. CT-SW4]|uniref:NAD-dependent epimerase/dehydratase family protein n=1 Tax=Chryseobacterium sp. SW-1 TaxID=3157343 RepID=UPI003B015D8A